MSSWQTLPLTEAEIKSVYRNEFFRITDSRYFKGSYSDKKLNEKEKNISMDKFYGKIKLCSIEDVKNFVRSANEVPVDVEVSSGRYIVDGKSILGLFSLNLSNNVMLKVDNNYIEKFKNWIDE